MDIRRQNRFSLDLTAAIKEVAEFQLVHGDAKAAIQLYEEALTTQDELEADDPNIALTFNELARAYEETPYQKRVQRLRALARQIRFTRSAESTSRVHSLKMLAEMYVEEGRFNRAGPMIAKANKIFLETADAEGQGTMNHFITLGDLRLKAAKLSPTDSLRNESFLEAQRWYQTALDISQRKGFRNEVLHALDGLAALRLEQKNFAEAERLYKQTLETRERNPNIDLAPQYMLIENLNGLATAAIGMGKLSDAEAYLLRGKKVVDGMSPTGIQFLRGMRGVDANVLGHFMSARLGELYSSQNRLQQADEQFKPLIEKLGSVPKEFLRDDYNARNYLETIRLAGKFYANQNNNVSAKAFYQLVWPENVRPTVRTAVDWPEENYAKSILAIAPDSCVEKMIEILNAYAELLKKAPPARDANIEFGILRLKARLQ